VHVTDNYGNVPEKYRSSSEEIKVDRRTYGYTPSVGEAIGSESYSTDSWFDYGKMPAFERWFLLARAGFLDLTPILKAMSPWIGLAFFVLAAFYFLIFKVFEAPAAKGAMLLLALILVLGGTFFKYIRVVEDHRNDLIQAARQARGMDVEKQGKIIGVLESVDRAGR